MTLEYHVLYIFVRQSCQQITACPLRWLSCPSRSVTLCQNKKLYLPWLENRGELILRYVNIVEYSYCIRPNIWNRIIFLFIFSLHPQFDRSTIKRLVAWVVWVALNCNGDVGQGSSQKNMILWKFFPNGSWTVKSISMCPSTLKGGYRKMFVFFHRFRWVQYMVGKSLKRLVRN